VIVKFLNLKGMTTISGTSNMASETMVASSSGRQPGTWREAAPMRRSNATRAEAGVMLETTLTGHDTFTRATLIGQVYLLKAVQ
jgi:hypothetical protein